MKYWDILNFLGISHKLVLEFYAMDTNGAAYGSKRSLQNTVLRLINKVFIVGNDIVINLSC